MTPEEIKQTIESGLDCEHVAVDGDGRHFQVLVVSGGFAGRSKLARHRLVYEALGERMREDVHALSMQTLTPEEWRQGRE